MEKLTETEIKEKKGRLYIAEFLSALKFHDNDRQTTIKVMRRKLVEIQRKDIESAGVVLIKKRRPPTSRKVIIKFSDSQTPPVVQHRRHPPAMAFHKRRPLSETLQLSTNNNFSETLVCKRQKINNQGGLNNIMDFIRRIGGSEAQLVIEKRLTSSDVTANQGRLLMPVLLGVKNQGFLRAHEKLQLGNKHNISVSVFDPERRKSTLNLAQWRMSRDYYVLKTKWNHLVNRNGFKENMVIQVFSFRVDQELCFALDRVE